MYLASPTSQVLFPCHFVGSLISNRFLTDFFFSCGFPGQSSGEWAIFQLRTQIKLANLIFHMKAVVSFPNQPSEPQLSLWAPVPGLLEKATEG